MKILVTGANGLLGQKLSMLLFQDKTVYPILTAREKLTFPIVRGEFSSLDITNAHAVKEVLSRLKPDIVINTAAMTLVDKCETEQEACWVANVTSVENL